MNFISCLSKFYKTQGFTGLFKGNSASIARIFPFSAIEFYSFELYKNIFIRGKPVDEYHFYRLFLCGTLAGLNAITLTYPLDVARTLLAVETKESQKSGLFNTLMSIYQKDGFRGFYKGYTIVFVVF